MVSLDVIVHLKIHLSLYVLGMLLAEKNRAPDEQRLKKKGYLNVSQNRKSENRSSQDLIQRLNIVIKDSGSLCLSALPSSR